MTDRLTEVLLIIGVGSLVSMLGVIGAVMFIGRVTSR